MSRWSTNLLLLQDAHGQINSIDFHRTHDFLVAGHDAGYISVYSTFEGRKLSVLDCSKYGVSHVRYTHHPKCIIHASTKVSTRNFLRNS
jgi:WD40 repeat protein